MEFIPKDFTVLLVDDREENLVSLAEILDNGSRKFIRATSGNEALRQVLKHDDIGLIMLDVQMPDMDGFEVARILKANPKTKDISIIFVTAISKEEQYVIKGFEEGAVDYLQKPLDINVTRAKVKVFEQLYFYQRQLKDTATDLSRINKQLEQFVYIVAHDLKSPLASITAILSLIEMDKEIVDNEEVMEYITLMSSAALHLSDMITAMLEHSRKNHLQQTIEEVNTKELVQQIAHLLFPPKHIHITVAESLPTFKTKKLKIQQVFQNLISNAIKYNDKPEGYITIGCADKGGYYEFFVKDNGPGIEEKDRSQIFGLFQTANNESKREGSTGVGLNVLKMTVEEEGGKVWVTSEPGEGSTFFFEWKK